MSVTRILARTMVTVTTCRGVINAHVHQDIWEPTVSQVSFSLLLSRYLRCHTTFHECASDKLISEEMIGSVLHIFSLQFANTRNSTWLS